MDEFINSFGQFVRQLVSGVNRPLQTWTHRCRSMILLRKRKQQRFKFAPVNPNMDNPNSRMSLWQAQIQMFGQERARHFKNLVLQNAKEAQEKRWPKLRRPPQQLHNSQITDVFSNVFWPFSSDYEVFLFFALCKILNFPDCAEIGFSSFKTRVNEKINSLISLRKKWSTFFIEHSDFRQMILKRNK